MNRQQILDAVRVALNPESELYKRVFVEYSDLTPEEAEHARARALAAPLTDVLRLQPEYAQNPMLAIRTYLALTTFPPERAAEVLVLRAMRASAETAVDWFANIVERGRAAGTVVMPLWQLTVEEPIPLSSTATLVPFSDLPQSSGKAWLEDPSNRIHGGGILAVASLGFNMPGAAITVRMVISPLFVNLPDFRQQPKDEFDVLDDIRLCLSAIGPYPLLGPIKWFQFDEPDVDALGGGGFGSNRLEVLPYSLPTPVPLDRSAAQRLVPLFLALRTTHRDRVRRSLQRLVQAMLRRDPGDRAADLSIALEVLLTEGPGEHTWKVSTRAGVLTGWDFASMLERRNIIAAAYQMRSSLVHSGAASDKVRVAGRGHQSASSVCEEATRICAAVIRAVIERGGTPEWPAFDVSGGVLGWR